LEQTEAPSRERTVAENQEFQARRKALDDALNVLANGRERRIFEARRAGRGSDHPRGAGGRVRHLARARAPDRGARLREGAESGDEPCRRRANACCANACCANACCANGCCAKRGRRGMSVTSKPAVVGFRPPFATGTLRLKNSGRANAICRADAPRHHRSSAASGTPCALSPGRSGANERHRPLTRERRFELA
jgi:hypothetical protein